MRFAKFAPLCAALMLGVAQSAETIVVGSVSANDVELLDGRIDTSDAPGATLFVSTAALQVALAINGSVELAATDFIAFEDGVDVQPNAVLTATTQVSGTSEIMLGQGQVLEGGGLELTSDSIIALGLSVIGGRAELTVNDSLFIAKTPETTSITVDDGQLVIDSNNTVDVFVPVTVKNGSIQIESRFLDLSPELNVQDSELLLSANAMTLPQSVRTEISMMGRDQDDPFATLRYQSLSFRSDTSDPQWTIALLDEIRPTGAYSYDLISFEYLGFFDSGTDFDTPSLSMFVLENALDGEALVGRLSAEGDRFIISLVGGEAIPLPAAGWLFAAMLGAGGLLRLVPTKGRTCAVR